MKYDAFIIGRIVQHSMNSRLSYSMHNGGSGSAPIPDGSDPGLAALLTSLDLGRFLPQFAKVSDTESIWLSPLRVARALNKI